MSQYLPRTFLLFTASMTAGRSAYLSSSLRSRAIAAMQIELRCHPPSHTSPPSSAPPPVLGVTIICSNRHGAHPSCPCPHHHLPCLLSSLLLSSSLLLRPPRRPPAPRTRHLHRRPHITIYCFVDMLIGLSASSLQPCSFFIISAK